MIRKWKLPTRMSLCNLLKALIIKTNFYLCGVFRSDLIWSFIVLPVKEPYAQS